MTTEAVSSRAKRSTSDGRRRAAVVVNPSKVGDPGAQREEIASLLGEAGWAPPMWLETTPEDPGSGQTRRAVAEGVEVVLACGGDGTVMSCASVLAGTEVALAVLPAGTGNLLALNLGLPTDLGAAVATAVGDARRRIDVGRLGDGEDVRCFTIMAGMGFDAQMLDGAAEQVKARIGAPAYVLSALRHLRERSMRVSVRLDDGPAMRRHARTVLVANVGRLQGGIPLIPQAEPDDGELDVAILSPGTLWHWLVLAWGVMRRKPQVARMETFRARHVEITSNRDQPRELDGEVIAAGRTLSVTIRPGALLLCVPAE